jgi:diguanylate cyclase (GGDEF)-like protein
MPAALPIRKNIPDPVRILLIEGERGCAERVIGALERIDWAYARIDTAASLRQALARLKLEKFDLLITELDLPDSGGLATLDELAGAFDRLIVVLSADESRALRDRAVSHGAFDLLSKEKVCEAAALERLLRLATAQASSIQPLRHGEARVRKAFELARGQEALARFGEAALALREPKELIDEAVRTAMDAVSTLEVAFIEAGDMPGVVGEGTAIVPVRYDGEVRGGLSVQGERVGAETLPFLNALASLLSTALQRMESERRLSFLAQFDPLTGLANRALLIDRLSQMIEAAKRRRTPLAMLFIDLDHFKIVNDALQHAGGDELLKETALRVQSVARVGDMVARVNGDEFVVVLPELERPEDAALVAQKVLERVSQPYMVRGEKTFLTASVGIAAYPADGDSVEALIGAAEAAMYRAKQAGRNTCRFFNTEITRRTRARARVAQELYQALERDEFQLLYQPKIDLASGRPCGAEALLRWRHPERGTISPSQFVPMLEETGLIVPVGEWVISRACEDLKAWSAAGLKVLPVAVNLSARQFRQRFLDRSIRSLVLGAGVDPALIELEITESQLMEDPDHAVRVMNALRDSGIRAAIDDFGTGYSSLAYLTRLPLAALKIDRSFVADALSDAADAAIVRTIIEMAHTLGFTVVAEGVETDGQMAFLRRFGCEQAQGYLFARPMSATDFTALI